MTTPKSMKRILTPQSLTTGALSGWFKLNMVRALWQKSSPALCLPAEAFLLPPLLQEFYYFMMHVTQTTTRLAAN